MSQLIDGQKIQKTLDNIYEEIRNQNVLSSQANKINVQLEFIRQMSNNASQASGEMSNTFYVYLVAVSIAAPLVAGLATAYLLYRDQKQFMFTSLMLEILIFIALLVLGIVSRYFIWKGFYDLSTKRHNAIKSLNKVKKHMKDNGITQEFIHEDLLLEEDADSIAEYKGIPVYIRRITILVWSFCFAGAIFMLAGFLMYRIAFALGWVANPFAYGVAIVAFLVTLIVSLWRAGEKKYW